MSKNTKQKLGPLSSFDLNHFLPYLLNLAAEVTSQSFQSIYKAEHGMTRVQWRVMANLGKHGSMTASEICRLTFIEKTKVSRAVQALSEKGLLSRSVAQDRRSEMLTLTRQGKVAFAALGKKARNFDQALRAQLGQETGKSLENALKALIK